MPALVRFRILTLHPASLSVSAGELAVSIQVDVLGDGSDLRPFLRLPDRICGRDPYYSATSRKAVLAELGREDFRDRQRVFVARDSGSPHARCVARISPTLKDADGRPFGMLGLFEAADQLDCVGAMFDAAAAWLEGNGVRFVVGPMDGDTWHKYRLNAGPFAERPFLMEPYNPPYYPSLWEACGFRRLESYYSLRVEDLAAAEKGTARIAKWAQRHGYRIRRIDMGRFGEELGVIYDLTCRIFQENFLYTDISRKDFLSLYDGVEALLDPDFVMLAQSPKGEDVGFLFAVPDNWRAVRAMGGHKDPLSLLKFLWLRGRTDAVNLKTLGVVPEHRRTGVSLQLVNRAYAEALRKGFRRANLCLIRDGNPSGRMDGGQGEAMRRYVLYQRDL